MLLDVLLGQLGELASHAVDDGHLDLAAPKVAPQHTSQAHDGTPHRLVGGIGLHIVHALLEEVGRLLFLGPRRGSEEGKKVSGAVHLVYLRSDARVVDADEEGRDGQRPHGRALGVHLRNVGDAAGQLGHGDGVAVLVGEVGGLVAGALDYRAGVGVQAAGEGADGRGDGVDGRDGGGVHEAVWDLLLGDDDAGISTADGHAGQARRRVGRLEGVFHLVQTPLRAEDGDVVVVVGVAAHGGRSAILMY
mmetsp:Transcript_18035/g.42614  ORF Transcript_18035/g.42614 Transcript_18035/m.42614 type:complete len:248 (+) Transcript_18035:641-1384(+)